MSNIKKLMMSAAGGGGLDVDEVFSTYLYDGTNDDGPNAAQTITNGIDLAGEGGMVWIKARDFSANHAIVDTVRGNTKYLESSTTSAEKTTSVGITSFNSNGYSLGADNTWQFNTDNAYVSEYASWTFRKAPKFFDIVTYTGDGVAGREIAHNLGSVPGCFILKATSTTGDWIVYHRGLSDPSNKALALHLTFAELDNTYFNDTDPTATHFVVGGQGLGINNSGVTYVAYLFAHNDGDGEFGPSGDQDIIKCGSYTGNGSSTGPVINLGFEPQWLLIKNASASANWELVDNMRDFRSPKINVGLQALNPNLSNAEAEGRAYGATATGFSIVDNHADVNASGNKYIYIAIRRGPLAPPEAGTEVFNPTYAYEFDIEGNTSSGNGIHGYLGNPTDLYIQGYLNGSSLNSIVRSRLTGGNYLVTNATNAETTSSINFWDNNVGSGFETSNSVNTSLITWNWKRAPGFFDAVAYTGAYGGLTINHNLGVVPEMMWVKARTGPSNVDWAVYHKDLDTDEYLFLNQSVATQGPRTIIWSDTRPTDSVFYAGGTTQDPYTSSNNYTYIAYLFASLPGISKVGSYTGNGSSMGDTQTIDCGFSSGARFVLIKRTSGTGEWFVFDTERGIVSGTDAYITLHSNAAQVSGGDYIDPHSSGFTVVQHPATETNTNGETYIFYAIA